MICEFRFANFAFRAISKVYSDNGQNLRPAIGDPEITLFRRQMPSNWQPKSRLNDWRHSQIVVALLLKGAGYGAHDIPQNLPHPPSI
jgi:hypothetical protein